MPIFSITNLKLAIMNADKTRGISIEYPNDMGLGELLDRTNELREAVLTSIENEKKNKEQEDLEKTKLEEKSE
jgi:hypothetical protein